jgi:hypothetical protein
MHSCDGTMHFGNVIVLKMKFHVSATFVIIEGAPSCKWPIVGTLHKNMDNFEKQNGNLI